MQRNFPILIILIISGIVLTPFSSAVTDTGSGIKTNATIKGDDLVSYNITSYSDSVDIGGKSDNILVGDGQISSIWEFIPGSDVASWGEHGQIKSAFDASNAYFLFSVDISMVWIAIQLDTDASIDPELGDGRDDLEPMAIGDDFWIFGETTEVSILGDAAAGGQSNPYAVPDVQNDLFWERILINDTDGVPVSVSWEIKRALVTGDIGGFDAVFSSDANITMMLASDIYHKTLAKVVMVKFALTNLTVGGEEPEPIVEDVEVKEVRDVAFYLFFYISISFFVGSLSYIIITVGTVYLLKKEIDIIE